METILITGARAPIALEIARSFHRQGHKVLMADSIQWTVSRWSNSIARYYYVPSPRFATHDFINKIKQIIDSERVTHLIPTCEEAFYISSFKDSFSCKVWCANIELMNQLHNKFLFTRIAQSWLPIPETCWVSEFTEWSHSNTFVFKPAYSRFAGSIMINQLVSESFFKTPEKSKWIAQKQITGKEICIYSIWDNGILKAYTAYHPLYRVGKGSGIFFEPVLHDSAFEKVKAFGQAIQYTGQLCFDVIIDYMNTPWFIECNPRGTSGAHLLYSHLTTAFLKSESCIYQTQTEYAVKCALGILHPFSLLQKRIREAKDVIYQPDDKLPFILQPLSLLEMTYQMLTNRITWLQATTHDIEWNGNEC